MRTRLSPAILVFAGALALVAVPKAASAQRYAYGPPPPPGIQRYGLVVGGSIGPGAFNFSDCNGCEALGALALQAEIGGMVAPNVALLFDWTGHIHPFGDGSVLSSNIFDGAVRVFLGRIFWLEGGVGVAYVNETDEFGFTLSQGWGFGLMGAAGVEVLQTTHFALDIQVRLSGGRVYSDPNVNVGNIAALLGAHWYL
jgi:hypothetical protein